MEIEKTRETSWKIQLKKINECIEITSVEISGEVRLIKLALMNNDNAVKVEMKKEEFFNFLSLISAFKDVVIGEESLIIDDDLDFIEEKQLEIQEEIPEINSELLEVQHDDTIEKQTDNKDGEELNPEEWDPW
jgi:hypothetical protein